MTIKRYDCYGYSFEECEMVEGEYCRWNDVEPIIAENSELLAELASERSLEFCEECNYPLSQCGEQAPDGEPTFDCAVCKLKSENSELRARLAVYEDGRPTFDEFLMCHIVVKGDESKKVIEYLRRIASANEVPNDKP